MTNTLPAKRQATPGKPKANPGPRLIRRSVSRREAAEAANRLRTTQVGTRYVVRFSAGQRLEHLVLLFSFTGLAVTGLAQTLSASPVASFILSILGGIDNDRAIHHILAFIFIVLSIYHVGLFVYQSFVNRRASRMFPDWSDFVQVVQMVKYNLGLSQIFPRFDRYTFEEKAEYWALIWGATVMGITGLIQWFPVFVTNILPGWAIPVANAFHKWEAILAVLAILTWHFYHVVLKKLNLSIFTGNMTLEEMEEEHPLELAYLERAAATLGSRTWPVLVEIPLEEPKVESASEVAAPAGGPDKGADQPLPQAAPAAGETNPAPDMEEALAAPSSESMVPSPGLGGEAGAVSAPEAAPHPETIEGGQASAEETVKAEVAAESAEEPG